MSSAEPKGVCFGIHPIIDGVTSAPDGAKYCTGNCTECYKEDRMCWTMGKGESILFAAH